MKQNKNGVYMDKEYLKFKDPYKVYFMIYKDVIYKTVQHNEEKHIIINIDTMVLYSITWELYFSLEWFNTLDQARATKYIYKNVFKLNQLKHWGQDDIYNYDHIEQPRLMEHNKNNIKHYKKAGITANTNYIQCC